MASSQCPGTSPARQCGGRRAGSPRGFTLTEMLVVMAIIGILSGLILGGVMTARKRGALMSTKTFVTQLEAAINHYEESYGDYPHGSGGVESAEYLYQALASPGWAGQCEFEAKQIADTDSDGRKELVDHWMQPIRYYHHRSYFEPPKETTFRLISIGPDAEEGTSDDITNFR